MICFSEICRRHRINPNKDRFFVDEIAVMYGVKALTVYYWFKRKRGPIMTYQESKTHKVFAYRHDLVRDLQDVIPSGISKTRT